VFAAKDVRQEVVVTEALLLLLLLAVRVPRGWVTAGRMGAGGSK